MITETLRTCWRSALWTTFLILPRMLLAQTPEATPAQAGRPPILVVRPDEDWSLLADPARRTEPLDRLKYIPLGERDGSYVSLGGEFRGTYEHVLNDNWSALPSGLNSFGLERFLAHVDLHVNPQVRLFLQLESGLEQGRPGGPRPIDEKRLDFLNAFLELRLAPGPHALSVRVGKQELQFGAGRLVSVREGPNVRQGFFGLRADQLIGGWHTTAFATRPAQDKLGFFNDGPTGSTGFWGVDSHRLWHLAAPREVELYYFGLNQKRAVFNQGSGHELRQTIGGRFATTLPPDPGSRRAVPHLDIESIYQFGSFGVVPVRAWGLSTESGVLFPQLPLRPRLDLRVDTASGDHQKHDGVLRTYNPLFPIGDYFSVLADTGPGPVNFRDIHPKLLLTPVPQITVTIDELLWWRASLGDGVYGVPGNLLVPTVGSSARFVGHRPGIETRWQMDRHSYLQADYGVFFAGPYLRQSGAARNLNYASVWVGYKF